MKQARLVRERRERRAMRVRKRVRGDAARPRLSVFRSHRHIYAQLIDDAVGRTLCASSSRVVCGEYGGTVAHAQKVGSDLAEKAKALSIGKIRFDRGHYRFHGRIKALAEAARKGGLEF